MPAGDTEEMHQQDIAETEKQRKRGQDDGPQSKQLADVVQQFDIEEKIGEHDKANGDGDSGGKEFHLEYPYAFQDNADSNKPHDRPSQNILRQ
jgi:hypothetical protein